MSLKLFNWYLLFTCLRIGTPEPNVEAFYWFELPGGTALHWATVAELPPAGDALATEDVGTSLTLLRLTCNIEAYFAVVLSLQVLFLIDDV